MARKSIRTNGSPPVVRAEESPKEVDEWDCVAVHEWLSANGFSDYAESIASVHKVSFPYNSVQFSCRSTVPPC